MTICIIELNDSEIRVAKGTDIIVRSPGCAVIQKDRLALGAGALKLSHLNPRATHNRFWSNLNQDSLSYSTRLARHNADLAYAHLLAIHEQAGKPEEIIFTVPGSYSNEQLSLLLGLAGACPFTAIGLVDTAVAACASVADNGSYIHADIHLHQTILTYLDVADNVTRSAVRIIDATGLSAIHDACAGFIADLFIKQSRFDPQHHAETEQALYDQIPQCLRSLQTNNEVLLEIQYKDTRHQAKLLREPLLAALQPLYQNIKDQIPDTTTCLISDRLSALPGFIEQLSSVEILDPDTVFQGCEEHILHIRSEGPALNFVTRLPVTAKPTISTTTRVSRDKPAVVVKHPATPVTHILHEHHAYPLVNGTLFLSAMGGISTTKEPDSHCSVLLNSQQAMLHPGNILTVFLNGQQVNDAILAHAGDIISFAGSKTEYTLINVLA